MKCIMIQTKDNKKLFIGGNTSRATFEFEIEFFKLLNR